MDFILEFLLELVVEVAWRPAATENSAAGFAIR